MVGRSLKEIIRKRKLLNWVMLFDLDVDPEPLDPSLMDGADPE
jgi:hypothetical protein